MSKTIWRFDVPINDEVVVEMPAGRAVLPHVVDSDRYPSGTVAGAFTVWAHVETESMSSPATFLIFGTGHPMPDLAGFNYVGSFSQLGGRLVWHVFTDVDVLR